MSDKNLLRKQLKMQRAAFQGEVRALADKAIYEYFKVFLNGNESFFVYNSFSDEVSTKLIQTAIMDAGKRLYLPVTEGGNMFAVPYGRMRKGEFGIEQPEGQAYNGGIDVTVIPLLAINGRGYRIGYGKGYYDRFLKGRNTVKIGLCYSFQMIDFKEDVWDIPLDYYICEKGVYIRNEDNFRQIQGNGPVGIQGQ